MNSKTFKYLAFALAMPILTALVWVIWVLLLPALREHFLHTVSNKVERKLNKKRKTKGLRPYTAKKGNK
jgi:Na+/proline symporter